MISSSASAELGVRLKDLARVEGPTPVALTGYGIVVGLTGTGDSSRNRVTLQALANNLENFGVQVSERDLSARNVASVMVTATLPAFAEIGDRLDIQVASSGDAKSLAGGTLLVTPLYAADRKLYALGQGALSVGGYLVESFSSSKRKNYPTAGQITQGGSVERSLLSDFDTRDRVVRIILDDPDYTTAQRIMNRVNALPNGYRSKAIHPGKIHIELAPNKSLMGAIAQLENIRISPDFVAKVVINEKTGIVVSGANVLISETSIAYGDLKIEIDTTFSASQPTGNFFPGDNTGTVLVPDTEITVEEGAAGPVALPQGTTVADLVQALYKMRLSTRDVINVLQSVKAAGALHAELVIR